MTGFREKLKTEGQTNKTNLSCRWVQKIPRPKTWTDRDRPLTDDKSRFIALSPFLEFCSMLSVESRPCWASSANEVKLTDGFTGCYVVKINILLPVLCAALWVGCSVQEL